MCLGVVLDSVPAATATLMPTGKRGEIRSNWMCIPMINYLCGALKAFKDAKFLLYHLTFQYNQIRGDADSILLLFNQVCFQWLFPKLSQMLTCMFQITRIWGETPPPNSMFCSRRMCFVLSFLCASIHTDENEPCAISAALGDL